MNFRPALGLVLCLAAARAGAAEVAVCVTGPDGQPVADTALVVEGETAASPTSRPPASIEQIDRDFVPYLTIVRRGTEIEFPNRDPLKHHVYSFSAAKPFEIKLYAGKPAAPVLFDKTGEVAIGCNIHDWMEAYVLVVDSPHFAKTGTDGCGRVSGLAAGSYRLRLWHPRQSQPVAERPLTLEAAAKLDLSATMMVRPPPPHAKPPADSGDY